MRRAGVDSADSVDRLSPGDDGVRARLELAREIADAAARVTADFFRSPKLETERKADGSVVTPADRSIERGARERIAEVFPGDAVLGEEFGEGDGGAARSGWRWIIDPIDGTDSFVRGIPTFATLIGIERAGELVIGLAEFPALDERLEGVVGEGARWQDRKRGVAPSSVSETDALGSSVIEITRPAVFSVKGERGVYDAAVEAVAKTRTWSDAYAFALVATGRIDGALAVRMSVWDVAAFGPIVRESGGVITRWDGSDAIDGATTIAANPAVHAGLKGIVDAHGRSV